MGENFSLILPPSSRQCVLLLSWRTTTQTSTTINPGICSVYALSAFFIIPMHCIWIPSAFLLKYITCTYFIVFCRKITCSFWCIHSYPLWNYSELQRGRDFIRLSPFCLRPHQLCPIKKKIKVRFSLIYNKKKTINKIRAPTLLMKISNAYCITLSLQ